MKPDHLPSVGVVGSGAMGRGIAQLFAQAGCSVVLHDANPQALDAAQAHLADTLARLVSRGKLDQARAEATLARVARAESLAEMAGCRVVIEAIVERLAPKQELFRALEAIVAPEAILATNTSSLSVTAIGAACERPARVAGLHFFNPVPLMRVVEVIGGARTDPAVLDELTALVQASGHVAVRAADMPGFIVNHAGRGYGTEALAIVGESVAGFEQIDRILREQVRFETGSGAAGFKLGPFELMDLTGLDVSHPVMESIYGQFYDEPRFRPSAIAAQRAAGGLLGRKTGRGFYEYGDKPGAGAGRSAAAPAPGAAQPSDAAAAGPATAGAAAPAPFARAWVDRARPEAAQAIGALLAAAGVPIDAGERPAPDALIVVAPLGTDASHTAAALGLDARRTVALDTLFPLQPAKRRVLMTTPATDPAWRDAAAAAFGHDGCAVDVIADSCGFVAQRVVAMIVAVACNIAQQGIASPADIDRAVTLGLGYPLGPLEMGDALGAATIEQILRNIERVTGDPRYRPGLWLSRRAVLGLSLRQA